MMTSANERQRQRNEMTSWSNFTLQMETSIQLIIMGSRNYQVPEAHPFIYSTSFLVSSFARSSNYPVP